MKSHGSFSFHSFSSFCVCICEFLLSIDQYSPLLSFYLLVIFSFSWLASFHGKLYSYASRELDPECMSVWGGGGGENSVCYHLQTNQTPKCHPSTRPSAPIADVLSKSHLRVEINRLLRIDRSCTKVRPQHTNISRVRRM